MQTPKIVNVRKVGEFKSGLCQSKDCGDIENSMRIVLYSLFADPQIDKFQDIKSESGGECVQRFHKSESSDDRLQFIF